MISDCYDTTFWLYILIEKITSKLVFRIFSEQNNSVIISEYQKYRPIWMNSAKQTYALM